MLYIDMADVRSEKYTQERLSNLIDSLYEVVVGFFTPLTCFFALH